MFHGSRATTLAARRVLSLAPPGTRPRTGLRRDRSDTTAKPRGSEETIAQPPATRPRTGQRAPAGWELLVARLPRLRLRLRVPRPMSMWAELARQRAASPLHFYVKVLTLATVGASVLMLAYSRLERWSAYGSFPRPVADALRDALYYGSYAPDQTRSQERARDSYRRALALCRELGLDLLSDPVVGIRLRIVAWLVQLGRHQDAAAALENVISDLVRAVAAIEQRLDFGRAATLAPIPVVTGPPSPRTDPPTTSVDRVAAATARTRSPGYVPAAPEAETRSARTGDVESRVNEEGEEKHDEEERWHRRRRLLRKAVECSLTLAGIYNEDHVLRPDKAQLSVIWAVETSLKELGRRQYDGVKSGEGDWVSRDEVGSMLEDLGRTYEKKSQFHLSIPLFFQSQRLCSDPCHKAVIMNNLAVSLAQHPAHAPFALMPSALAVPEDKVVPAVPSSRRGFLEAAERWAQNASSLAASTTGAERTAECDEACAVAFCTLGDVLEALGRRPDARVALAQAHQLGTQLGLAHVVTRTAQRMRELQ